MAFFAFRTYPEGIITEPKTRRACLLCCTLPLHLLMSRPHWLPQSFLHKDPDFYCMIGQPEAPYHVQQTISRMMHPHQGFHLQIPTKRWGFRYGIFQWKANMILWYWIMLIQTYSDLMQMVWSFFLRILLSSFPFQQNRNQLQNWNLNLKLQQLIYKSKQQYLVCNIKERNVILLLNDISNLFPLFRSWINTSWVVSTAMKQHKRSFWGCLETKINKLSWIKEVNLAWKWRLYWNNTK